MLIIYNKTRDRYLEGIIDKWVDIDNAHTFIYFSEHYLESIKRINGNDKVIVITCEFFDFT